MSRYNNESNIFSVLLNEGNKETRQLSLIQGKKNLQQSFLIQGITSLTEMMQERTSLTETIQEETDKLSLLQQHQYEIQQEIKAKQAKIQMMKQIEEIRYCDTKNVKHCTRINTVLISKKASYHNGTNCTYQGCIFEHPKEHKPSNITHNQKSTNDDKSTNAFLHENTTHTTIQSKKRKYDIFNNDSQLCENPRKIAKIDISGLTETTTTISFIQEHIITLSTPKSLNTIQQLSQPENLDEIISNHLSQLMLKRHERYERQRYDNIVSNRFQPSKKDCKTLKTICDTNQFNFSNVTLDRWVKIVNKPLFESIKGHQALDIHSDQLIRAEKIAQYMLERKLYRIWMMDGDGRMVLNITKALRSLIKKYDIEIDLNKFKFYICELDKNVDKWHKLFFPSNVTSLNVNIFDILKTQNPSICQQSLVYFNFCGITANMENVTEFFNSCDNPWKYIFYSFSTRKLSTEHNKFLKTGSTLVSNRANYFVTYVKNRVDDKTVKPLQIVIKFNHTSTNLSSPYKIPKRIKCDSD